MIVVSDTSPVTTLIQIGKVDLLQKLYGEVLLPEAVRDELSLTHKSLPDFFRCVPVLNHGAVKKLLEELNAGEAEAIVLAKEKHADVLLIDEIEGREVLGEIENQTTFYISEEIKSLALKRAGEL